MTALPVAVLVGDSIRLGYQDTVARDLAGLVEMRAPTVNCQSSRELLANLGEWVLPHMAHGAIVHLNAGLHDVRRRPETGGRPKVTVDEYAENLRSILDQLHAAGAGCVVLATTTAVDDHRHRRARLSERTEADVVAYNRALKVVADAANVPVSDLHEVVAGDPARLIGDDGVHLTKLGYERVGAAVADAVRRSL